MVSKNSLGKKILTYLVIVIALAAFIFPIYWMFVASFKENSILMRVPPQLYPTFKAIDNYISIITNTKYLNYIKNSFVVASLTVIVDLALAIFAGYSLSRPEDDHDADIVCSGVSHGGHHHFPVQPVLKAEADEFLSGTDAGGRCHVPAAVRLDDEVLLRFRTQVSG